MKEEEEEKEEEKEEEEEQRDKGGSGAEGDKDLEGGVGEEKNGSGPEDKGEQLLYENKGVCSCSHTSFQLSLHVESQFSKTPKLVQIRF